MNVLDAMYKTVHNVKHGGSPVLAKRLGMSSAVLNSKVNPNTETHHLRLDEALAIMTLTDDYQAMHAIADQLGGVFIKLDDTELTNTETLSVLSLSLAVKQGKVFQSIQNLLLSDMRCVNSIKGADEMLAKLIIKCQKLREILKNV